MAFKTPPNLRAKCNVSRTCSNKKRPNIDGRNALNEVIKNGQPGQVYSPIIPFISVWRTIGINESITLPYEPSGTYSGTIDWGDGTKTDNSYNNITHKIGRAHV